MADVDDFPPHHHHKPLNELLLKFDHAVMQMKGSITPPIGPATASPAVTPEGLLANITRDLISQDKRVPQDIGILISLLDTAINHGLVDDRKYLVRHDEAACLAWSTDVK